MLLSGNHAEIEQWRHERALERTRASRGDLLEKLELQETGQELYIPEALAGVPARPSLPKRTKYFKLMSAEKADRSANHVKCDQ